MAGTTNPMLLALKGHITVVFLDQQVVEGEYITQDIHNIFITIDNEPVMIPRSQIRYIKGTTISQIEVDTSQDSFGESVSAPAQVPIAAPVEKALFDEEDEDTTDKIAAFEQAPIPVEETDDDTATFELPESPIPAFDFDDEEDGTVVLPPDSNQFVEEDDDLTFVLPPTPQESDEDDATFVLPPGGFVDEEDDITLKLADQQPTPTATLVCTTGPHSGQVFQLSSASISIGRSSDNNIPLSGDKEISRRHSRITLEGGKFVIKDQGSLNGTFVNNEVVTDSHILQNGDEILVGISTLKYEEM